MALQPFAGARPRLSLASTALTLATAIMVLLAPTTRAIQTLTDDNLRSIPGAGDDFDIVDGKLLAPILIPRVSGTEGNVRVQEHFVAFFSENLPEWDMLWQNSTSKTPVTGDDDVPFSNIIFRRDPPWATEGEVGRLTLVAHYDSKYTPAGFIGATDSAAPCAMLMHVARSIDEGLTKKWEAMQANGDADDMLDAVEGVQIIFLDGEEAFKTWSATDSLYGARSLAEEWDDKFHPAMSTFRTHLDSISLFVLLDLLGSSGTTIPSYFLTTHWAYRNLASLEQRMRDLGLLTADKPDKIFFEADKEPKGFGGSRIEDDHVPFMQRGVDILHLIPTQFPRVWHTINDDGEHLDLPSVHDWAKLVTAFAAEWMEIGEFLGDGGKRAATNGQGSSGTESVKSKRTEL